MKRPTGIPVIEYTTIEESIDVESIVSCRNHVYRVEIEGFTGDIDVTVSYLHSLDRLLTINEGGNNIIQEGEEEPLTDKAKSLRDAQHRANVLISRWETKLFTAEERERYGL